MKKFIILLTFSMFVIAVSAQTTFSQPTQRGNFVIGTRLGFSSAKSSVDVQSATGSIKGDGGSSYQLNVSPGIGYFVANNFVIGVGMDLVRTNSKTGVDLAGGTSAPQESNNNNALFGPFIRYFIPFGEDKAFFIGSTLGFGNSKNQFTAGGTTQSINTSLLSVGVGPGFTIYSSNGLALEALVKYNFANSNSKIDVQGIQRTSKTWTNAIDFSVGVQYYFGGFRTVAVAK
jgi:Outer membrane protein beta-barrel domain